MAVIADAGTLKTAVADYLNRSDLTTFVPNFVQNAEAKFFKNLRLRAMENALTVTIGAGVAALPTSPRYVDLKYAYVDQSPIVWLDRQPAEQIYRRYPVRSGTAEVPRMIAREGENFIFGPFPGDHVIKGIYYAALTALASATTTAVNRLLLDAPDLYLYGSLLEAESFIIGDPRLVMWKSFYDVAIDAVKVEERREAVAGSSPKSIYSGAA